MEFNYSHLDTQDLTTEIDNLKLAMNKWSTEAKKDYPESWKHRKRRLKALQDEISNRKIK